MGTTIFSPLKCGVLTGKYINEIPEDSRMNSKNERTKQMMEKKLDLRKQNLC
jgi:aryl-alcohol dehydrogenase-like predicted oxidoreductase